MSIEVHTLLFLLLLMCTNIIFLRFIIMSSNVKRTYIISSNYSNVLISMFIAILTMLLLLVNGLKLLPILSVCILIGFATLIILVLAEKFTKYEMMIYNLDKAKFAEIIECSDIVENSSVTVNPIELPYYKWLFKAPRTAWRISYKDYNIGKEISALVMKEKNSSKFPTLKIFTYTVILYLMLYATLSLF